MSFSILLLLKGYFTSYLSILGTFPLAILESMALITHIMSMYVIFGGSSHFSS